MKKIICLFLFAGAALTATAQRIETDLLDNLVFISESNGYKATLDLQGAGTATLTDTRGNEMLFQKKFLKKFYPGIHSSTTKEEAFFREIIERYRLAEQRNFRVVLDLDANGEPTQNNLLNRSESEPRERREPATTEADTALTFHWHENGRSAELGKNAAGRWLYTDSAHNRFEFGATTWRKLLLQFGHEQAIFQFLIRECLE